MDRENLIAQAKYEYAKLADIESRYSDISPEQYYENLLGKVIDGITAGKFDHCKSGLEIVEAVANRKDEWMKKLDNLR